jgi:hypothetical protein
MHDHISSWGQPAGRSYDSGTAGNRKGTIMVDEDIAGANIAATAGVKPGSAGQGYLGCLKMDLAWQNRARIKKPEILILRRGCVVQLGTVCGVSRIADTDNAPVSEGNALGGRQSYVRSFGRSKRPGVDVRQDLP